jgi:formyltetrahydrofolate-dependent phosphoribosylglycinamide formyltransferase
LKIAVFVSGRGSNLQAILDSQDLKNKVEVKAVVSDKKECAAFLIAEKYSIPYYSMTHMGYKELNEFFFQQQVGLIVLAGFLKLIPSEFIENYQGRIINIHPALLPAFSGKGMYGINVHNAVFESSAKVSGASVHFVDSTYDTGRIIAQKCVDISGVKSPTEIAEKVLKIEHFILPFVIGKFADNKIKEINNRIILVD